MPASAAPAKRFSIEKLKRAGTILLYVFLMASCTLAPFSQPAGPTSTVSPRESTQAGSPSPQPTQETMDIFLRINSIGYLPGDTKIGLALTDRDLTGSQFEVAGPLGVVASGQVGADRGAYASFAHLYELDFSSFSEQGTFTLQIGEVHSDPFEISPDVYKPLIPLTLQFFDVQRCGSGPAEMHSQCHVSDGVIAAGPRKGRKLDTTGGWHDAGDYLKFYGTTSFTVDMMLTAYLQQPKVFQPDDPKKIPAVLQEARVGLDWLEKMWRPGDVSTFYYQVGDISDHQKWRMPEDDPEQPPRPVWPVEEGKGANLAGKGAAAMAMAAVIWGDKTQTFYDRDYSRSMLKAAELLYKYGKSRPRVQSAEGFYEETSSSDDMALGAAELYRATGDAAYLKDARAYAFEAGSAGSLDWNNVHALAHYELAKIDPQSMAQSRQFLEADLFPAEAFTHQKPFFTGVNEFYWGVNENLAGLALEAMWYEDLTFNQRYRAVGQRQRDYLLGANPWGVCWVSAGCLGRMPQKPHHQVADLSGQTLAGFWDEGPVPSSSFASSDIRLDNEDAFGPFQDDSAVYHDDRADYMTNEPTISMNAIGLALAAWYAK
jgi:endoglucanase